MIGSCLAFNPCCKCVEKGMCNICELTYRRNGQLADSADLAEEIFAEIERGECKLSDFVSKSYLAELKKKYIGKDINVTTNKEEGK